MIKPYLTWVQNSLKYDERRRVEETNLRLLVHMCLQLRVMHVLTRMCEEVGVIYALHP